MLSLFLSEISSVLLPRPPAAAAAANVGEWKAPLSESIATPFHVKGSPPATTAASSRSPTFSKKISCQLPHNVDLNVLQKLATTARRYYAGRAFRGLFKELDGLRGNVTKRGDRWRHEVQGVVNKDVPIL